MNHKLSTGHILLDTFFDFLESTQYLFLISEFEASRGWAVPWFLGIEAVSLPITSQAYTAGSGMLQAQHFQSGKLPLRL